jgi:hypothetical protein
MELLPSVPRTRENCRTQCTHGLQPLDSSPSGGDRGIASRERRASASGLKPSRSHHTLCKSHCQNQPTQKIKSVFTAPKHSSSPVVPIKNIIANCWALQPPIWSFLGFESTYAKSGLFPSDHSGREKSSTLGSSAKKNPSDHRFLSLSVAKP